MKGTNMKRILKTGMATLTALVMIAGLVAASTDTVQAEEKLMPANKVIKNYVKAIGGKKAVMALTESTMTGKMEMAAAGISGDLKVKTKAPDLLVIEIEIPGMGVIRTGYDGEVAWSLNPMTGPEIMEGKMLDQMKREADFYGILHQSDRYQSMETVEKTDFHGDMCWKLKLVTTGGQELFEYFSVESSLLKGSESTQESQMGEMKIVGVLSDYKEFGGIRYPTKAVQIMGPGMEQTFSFDTVSFSGVQDSDFELPAEIKGMLPAGDEGDSDE
jgi:hypothetical protein